VAVDSEKIFGESSKWTAKFRLPDLSIRRQTAFRWKGIRSCNMALRKVDYIEINGFDETFVGWGHEERTLFCVCTMQGFVVRTVFTRRRLYHLWHPESSRDRENANARRVRNESETS